MTRSSLEAERRRRALAWARVHPLTRASIAFMRADAAAPSLWEVAFPIVDAHGRRVPAGARPSAPPPPRVTNHQKRADRMRKRRNATPN